MFKAVLEEYYDDYNRELIEIERESIEEILMYIYNVHKNSHNEDSGFYIGTQYYGVDAYNSLTDKFCGPGTLWLLNIAYKDTIIFEKGKYISPKTRAIFDKFEETVKHREVRKYGEF